MKHTLKNSKSKVIKKKLTIKNKSKFNYNKSKYNYNNYKDNYYKHNNMLGGSNIINFIKVLEELSKIVKNKGDVFKASAPILALPRAGTIIASTPAHSAVRQMAPKFRTSVTRSRIINRGGSPLSTAFITTFS